MVNRETTSKEYRKLVKATDAFNNAIIILKKAYLYGLDPDKYCHLECSAEEDSQARKQLLVLMDYLIKMHNDDDVPDLSFMHPDVLRRFKKTVEGSFSKKMKTIRKNLEEGKELESDSFDMLDRFVMILDMERSAIFENSILITE